MGVFTTKKRIPEVVFDLEKDFERFCEISKTLNDLCSKKETYELMDEIVKKGKIANYGVSVWKISDAMEAIKFKNVKSIQLVLIMETQQKNLQVRR